MLETIREFAAERLEELPDVSELRDRHAAWFVALGERARPELDARRGPRMARPARTPSMRTCGRRSSTCSRARTTTDVLQLVGAIWLYWASAGALDGGPALPDLRARRSAATSSPRALGRCFLGRCDPGAVAGRPRRGRSVGRLRALESRPEGRTAAWRGRGRAYCSRWSRGTADIGTRPARCTRSRSVLARNVDDGWFISVAP